MQTSEARETSSRLSIVELMLNGPDDVTSTSKPKNLSNNKLGNILDSDESSYESKTAENTEHANIFSIVAAAYHLCRLAGEEIKAVFESGTLGTIDKMNNGMRLTRSKRHLAIDPLTSADITSQKIIIGGLQSTFPNLIIVGEEGTLEMSADEIIQPSNLELPCNINITSEYDNLLWKDLVVWVDPLDGTKCYTMGQKEFVTILIGIAYKGRPIAGIISVPFGNDTFWAIVNIGVFKNDKPYHIQSNATTQTTQTDIDLLSHNDSPNISVIGRMLSQRSIPLSVAELESIDVDSDDDNTTDRPMRRVVTSLYQYSQCHSYLDKCEPDLVLPTGGAGAKMICLVEGVADAYVFAQSGTKKWDTCGPEAILLSIGGILTQPDGITLLKYGRNEPYLNANGFIATVTHRSDVDKQKFHSSFCHS